jgi:hypothetical protein
LSKGACCGSGMGESGGARARNRAVDPFRFATWGRRCGAGPVHDSPGGAVVTAELHRSECTHGPYSDRRAVSVAYDGLAYTLLRERGELRSGNRVIDTSGRHVRFVL